MSKRTEAHDLARSRLFLTVEDVDFIQDIVERYKPECIVDLGSGSGTTSGAVLLTAIDDVHVHTYDIAENAIHSTKEFHRNCGTSNRWHGEVMDSVKAASEFQDNFIDFLMIDTSHEYEHTVRELEAWAPKVQPGAPVWMHDYTDEYPGVKRAVDEAVARGEFEILELRGLGLLGRFTTP